VERHNAPSAFAVARIKTYPRCETNSASLSGLLLPIGLGAKILFVPAHGPSTPILSVVVKFQTAVPSGLCERRRELAVFPQSGQQRRGGEL